MSDWLNSVSGFFQTISNAIQGFFTGILGFFSFKDVALGFFKGGIVEVLPHFLVPFFGLSLAVLIIKLVLDLL